MNQLKYLIYTFIVLFLANSLLSCSKQESSPDKSYQIHGEITGINDGNIKLVKLNLVNNEQINVDSTQIENGKFSFSGKVKSPYLHTLILDDTLVKIHFFLENKNIKIIGNIDNLDHTKIIGSREDSLFHSYQIDDIFDRKKGMEIMLKYPDYTFSAFTAYYQFQLHTIDTDSLDFIMQQFSESVKKSIYYKHLDTLYSTIKRVAVAQPAPDFDIPDTNNQIIQLSDFKGKFILIDFWASWCAPCRAANPHLIKVFNKFKNKNFTIVGISIDKNKKRWLNAIEEDQLPWTNLSNLKGWDEVSKQYGVKSVPQNFLIDPNGIIIAKNIEPDNMIEKLNLLLPNID